MNIEFLIPASPTPSFYSQIAFFRKSLDHLGGLYKHAKVIAVFGDSEITELPNVWQARLRNVEIVWADPVDFRNIVYFAQGEKRYDAFSADADVICLCDADTLLVRPIPELLAAIVNRPALCATIAHYPPFATEARWNDIFLNIIGKHIPLHFKHTLMDHNAILETGRPLNCPFYVNQGILIGTQDQFRKINKNIRQMREAFNTTYDEVFLSGQIALTLAIYKSNIPYRTLPLRYNYPNDPIADELYPGELEDVAFIHYLRRETFDRAKIFSSQEEFDRFVNLELQGSNQVFQNFVKNISGGTYPWQ